MIVTVHLLCGSKAVSYGGVFYVMIIQLHSRLGLGACSPRKILKNSVIWCGFVYIRCGSDFILNNC